MCLLRLPLNQSLDTFLSPLVTIILHSPLRWLVEMNLSPFHHFFHDLWHVSVTPRLTLVNAVAGADGFGGGDIYGV